MLVELTQDPFATTTTLAIYRDAEHPRELLAIEYDATGYVTVVHIDNAKPLKHRVTRHSCLTFAQLRALLFPQRQEPPDAMTIKIKHDYRVVQDGAATYADGFRDGYAYAGGTTE